MTKVQLLTLKTCVYCPSAKKMWQDLKKDHSFDYEEIDATSDKGQDLVQRHGVMSVPTTIIDGKVAFVGVPEKGKAEKAVSK